MTRHHQLNRRRPQRLNSVQILLPRHTENPLHTLILQRRHKKIRTLSHQRIPLDSFAPTRDVATAAPCSSFVRSYCLSATSFRPHGENRARCVHQDAVGVAAQQHLAHRRPAPDPDDAELGIDLVQHAQHLLGGFAAPDELADAELDAGFLQGGRCPVEVGRLGEAGIGEGVTAGRVDDDERLFALGGNVRRRRQSAARPAGVGV